MSWIDIAMIALIAACGAGAVAWAFAFEWVGEPPWHHPTHDDLPDPGLDPVETELQWMMEHAGHRSHA